MLEPGSALLVAALAVAEGASAVEALAIEEGRKEDGERGREAEKGERGEKVCKFNEFKKLRLNHAILPAGSERSSARRVLRGGWVEGADLCW